jgi:hypothetical protein
MKTAGVWGLFGNIFGRTGGEVVLAEEVSALVVLCEEQQVPHRAWRPVRNDKVKRREQGARCELA